VGTPDHPPISPPIDVAFRARAAVDVTGYARWAIARSISESPDSLARIAPALVCDIVVCDSCAGPARPWTRLGASYLGTGVGTKSPPDMVRTSLGIDVDVLRLGILLPVIYSLSSLTCGFASLLSMLAHAASEQQIITATMAGFSIWSPLFE